MAGENLDLSSGNSFNSPQSEGKDNRRFLGIQLACCKIYVRIYLNREETTYEGECPRCGRRVQIRVGPGGSESRFFTAY